MPSLSLEMTYDQPEMAILYVWPVYNLSFRPQVWSIMFVCVCLCACAHTREHVVRVQIYLRVCLTLSSKCTGYWWRLLLRVRKNPNSILDHKAVPWQVFRSIPSVPTGEQQNRILKYAMAASFRTYSSHLYNIHYWQRQNQPPIWLMVAGIT